MEEDHPGDEFGVPGDEHPEDPFDRQRCIPGWDHDRIRDQVACVLGVGGIGSSVAMCLCRMGVNKIILIDNDFVEASNLNRQILFGLEDVGKKKVDAAVRSLQTHNVGNSTIEAHFTDALGEWRKVVEHVKESTVVFNCIDFGEYFDFAVTSLCVKLAIPCSTGSTYANNWIVDFYTCKEEEACWACFNQPKDTETLSKLLPPTIDQLPDLNFLKKDPAFTTRRVGSSVLACATGSNMVVTAWINRMFGFATPNWSKFDLTTFECFSFPVEKNPDCLICCKGES